MKNVLQWILLAVVVYFGLHIALVALSFLFKIAFSVIIVAAAYYLYTTLSGNRSSITGSSGRSLR